MIPVTYTVSADVSRSPDVVFNFITNLSSWWVEEFAGEPLQQDAAFILKMGDAHFSKNIVTDFVPGKKFAWVTTESRRSADSFDWTGTKMIFELSPAGNGTKITFTYNGVVFENEQNRLKEICNYCIKDLLYKYLESFTTTIDIARPAQEVFNSITNVPNWWSKDFEGSCSNMNDQFTIHHPGQHYSKQRVTEVMPGKKLVWLVTESEMPWLQKNRQEWTDTKMIFELSESGDKTMLRFTHFGLVPKMECYSLCKTGWTMVVNDWLPHLISHGTASPGMSKAPEIRDQLLAERDRLK